MPTISQSVLDNLLFLKKISKTKSPKNRKKYLNLATTAELLSIIECAYNILKGRFRLTSRQRNRLAAQIEVFRRIGRTRSPRGLRSILQRGGGLSVIPALLTPIIFEAIRSLSSNN